MNRPPLDLDDLHELTWGFAGQRVITVAGRVGLLRLLAERSVRPEEAAAELSLDPLPTGKMLRALAALGLLEVDGGRFRVVASLAPFFREGPDDILPSLAHSHDLYDRWGENLEPWLRGQEWSTKRRDVAGTRRFGAAMRGMGAQVARRLAATLDLTGLKTMLDVGGGFGHYAAVLCEAMPGLEATVLDTEEVAEIATAEQSAGRLAGRINFVGGDYLTSDYGRGFDLVLFANVLHQESPERAAVMVRRGAAALAPGGRVAVVDFQVDDAQCRNVMGTLFAINMRSFGDTHSEPRIRGWMEAAGLGDIRRTDLGRLRWLIVGRRPQ